MARTFQKITGFQLKTCKDLQEFCEHQGKGGYLYSLTPEVYRAEDGIDYMIINVLAYRIHAGDPPDGKLLA